MRCVRRAFSLAAKPSNHSGCNAHESALLHREEMTSLLQGELYRDRSHPVYNFLFTYYHFSPKVLFQYSPGVGNSFRVTDEMRCAGLVPERGLRLIEEDVYAVCPAEVTVVPPQLAALQNTLRILRNVQNRRPVLSCFGLHEWAMLYRLPDTSIRKQSLPLRVSQNELESVVESHHLRCTHFDAFRFFTGEAKIRNAIQAPQGDTNGKKTKDNCSSGKHMTRASQADLEQPGCIHTHMDLFKWAVKLFPFASSQLLLESLSLALTARDIDMRASPYDLKCYYDEQRLPDCRFGAEPIRIETMQGKAEYIALQQILMERARPIRNELIDVYTLVIDQITCKV